MRGALSVGVSQVISMVAALGITVLLARWLAPVDYGTYAFIVAVLLWIGNFSEIGVYSAASRLLARSDDEAARRQLVGACTVVAFALFVVFDVVVAAAAPIVGLVFDTRAETALFYAAPFAGGLALELAVLYLCQGARRQDLLAIRNIIGRPCALALVVGAHMAGVLTVSLACVALALGSTISSSVVFARLRPARSELRQGWATIRKEMRRANDGAMYVGRLLGSSMFNIDRMLIGYFLTASAVGYYALAFSLVAPITLGVQSVAISAYPSLARARTIPRRFLSLSLAWLVGSAALGYVLIDFFIRRFLPAYQPTLALLVPAILTAAILGMTVLFNQFLSAHGRGRTLRRISIVFAISNLVLYFTLIPLAGIKGAAWASLITVVVPLAGNLIAYERYRRTSERSQHASFPGAQAELTLDARAESIVAQ